MDGEDNGNPLDRGGFPVPRGHAAAAAALQDRRARLLRDDGQPVVAGRSITWAEIHERRPVIIISETLAREYWQEPSQALGKRVAQSAAAALARDRGRGRQ